MKNDLRFVLALVAVGLGALGVGILVFTTFFMARKFGWRGEKHTVFVNLGGVLTDRIVLNLCLAILIVEDGFNLVYYTFRPTTFPHLSLWLRWPFLIFVMVMVWLCGLRLASHYFKAAREIEKGGSGSSFLTTTP